MKPQKAPRYKANVEFDANWLAQNTGERPATHLSLEVYYSKGGESAFTGSVNKRGYFLGLNVVTVEGGYESFIVMDKRGFKVCIEEAARLNRSRLEYLGTTVLHHKDAIYAEFAKNDRAAVLQLLKRVATDNFHEALTKSFAAGA